MSTHFKPRCLPNVIVGSALGSRVQDIICSTEVAFASLHGVPMAHAKKSRPGRDERLAVLRPHIAGIDALVAQPPPGAAADDVLDAAVVAVTAKALLAGKEHRLGERRHDAKGLVMEIVTPRLGYHP